jgi:NAD-dependent dihydropyrimidine dehydrogenase PreA subunit/flavodoxin
MIFYFSATGNSLYAAQKLAEATGDRLVDIGNALRQNQYSYDIVDDEQLGFVAPTFAGTLPGTVALFIERLDLTGYNSQYVCGIFTCGGSDGFESAALYAALKAKGVGFNGSFTLVMPDNYIVWSNVPAKPQLDAILSKADTALDSIIAEVKAKHDGKIDTQIPRMPFMPLTEVSAAKGTSILRVDEKCTGCGLCAEICPMKCIALENGKPQWEGRCSMCLACLHRCPASAVQHGNDTQSKGRYINPNVQF